MEIKKSEQIRTLSDREQAREKLPIWYGSRGNFTHGVNETIINARDIIIGNFDEGVIEVELFDDLQTVKVTDSGTGMPIFGETDGVKNYVLLLETLFAGSNYSNLENNVVSGGTNGIGSTVLNATSSVFEVIARRNNKTYIVKYKDGGIFQSYEELDGSDIPHGTTVLFRLDETMYENITYDKDYFIDFLNKTSSTTKNIKYIFKYNEETYEYLYESRLDYLLNNSKNVMSNWIEFKDKTFNTKIQKDGVNAVQKDNHYAAISLSTDPICETFLNGVYLKDGGFIVDGIVDGIKKVFGKEDKKLKLTDEDVKMSFNIYGIVDSNFPEYKGQTKFSTENKTYKKNMTKLIMDEFEIIKVENSTLFKQMFDHLIQVNKFNQKNDDAIKRLKKTLKESTGKVKIEGLKDCDMRHSSLNERILILDEGLSANSTIIDSFDNRYMGCIGLRGRFINALKSSVKDVLNNIPAQAIIGALGCGLEIPKSELSLYKGMETFNIEKLRYGSVAILCDADSFGKGISLSLISFFKKFMPTLLKQGRIYLVTSPRFEVKDKKRNVYYAYNEKERDEIVEKLGDNFSSIGIKKGLGEFDKEEFWEYVLAPEARKNTFFKVVYEGEEEEISQWFDTLMGEDILRRKEFVRKNIVNVDLNSID